LGLNGRYFVMKELYTKPVVDVEKFDTVDVVTTSINGNIQIEDVDND
jgi:hypothetical protein